MSHAKAYPIWPDHLMIRDTGLNDDMGGLGQRIYTTAGAGYAKRKYVREDMPVVGWVKCSERMPGMGPVLCYLEGASHHTGGDISWRRTGICILWHNVEEAACTISGGWYRDDYEAAIKKIDADSAEITHWMRLPGAPT